MTYDAYRLSALGTGLVDGLGNSVMLRGSNVDSNEYSSSYFTIQDLQTIKNAGGNCVEIHQLRVGKMMPQRDTVDPAYFTNYVDRWVSFCEQTRVYCILNVRELKWVSYGAGMPDWMLDGHGYGTSPYNESTIDRAYIDFMDTDNPLQNDNRQCFINLWKYVATRYNDSQFVMFGLMNEPLCHVELDGTQATHLGITYSRLMQQVVDGIRSVGNNNLVFIDRPYVWDFNRVQPVNGTNIVWEDHLYVSPGFSLAQWESIMETQIVRRFSTVFQKPVYMGEYGFDPFTMYQDYASWPSELAAEVAYLKTHVAGCSWHTWGVLKGEYYSVNGLYLNQTMSDYVLQTIFG